MLVSTSFEVNCLRDLVEQLAATVVDHGAAVDAVESV
jgi:hypothetical protein